MSVKEAIGSALISLPFVALTAIMYLGGGLLGVVVVWGISGLVAGCILLGCRLLYSE